MPYWTNSSSERLLKGLSISDTSSCEEESIGNHHAPLFTKEDEQRVYDKDLKPELSERPATSDNEKEESSDDSDIVFDNVSTFCVSIEYRSSKKFVSNCAPKISGRNNRTQRKLYNI